MKHLKILVLLVTITLAESIDHEDVLNTCIDAMFHKRTPEPEPSLHGECKPWRARACCDHESTVQFHQTDNWLDFDMNHCQALSNSCRTYFLRDLCFYECSPNTGPWITEQVIRIRNERFLNAPMCQSECDAWWDACKNDFTCHANWGRGFNWTTGTNTCPTGKTCRPFTAVYGDATRFCNIIWDHSWKVVSDEQPCLRLTFLGRNPNDAVAEYYAKLPPVNAVVG